MFESILVHVRIRWRNPHFEKITFCRYPYIYIFIYIYLFIYLNLYACTRLCLYLYVGVCRWRNPHLETNHTLPLSINIYIYTHLSLYIRIRLCLYLYMCVFSWQNPLLEQIIFCRYPYLFTYIHTDRQTDIHTSRLEPICIYTVMSLLVYVRI